MIPLGPEDIVVNDDLICDRLSADMLFRLAVVDWHVAGINRTAAVSLDLPFPPK